MSTPSAFKRLKRLIRYLGLRVLLSAIQLLPLSWAGRLGELFGAFAFKLARGERRKAYESLQVAFPELNPQERVATASASFRHLGRCAFELACVQKLDADADRWVEWPAENRRVLEEAMARGKGAVVVTGHVGNWELFARRVAQAGFPTQCIGRETSDVRMTQLVEAFRQSGGLGTIWRSRPESAKRMLKTLRAGEILILAIDQDTRVQSVFVPFFGRLAATPKGAAALALKTGAAALVGFCQRGENGRYSISVKELSVTPNAETEDAVRELTARMTEEIEQAIRRAPAQWVWMHRRWKTRPC